MHGGIFIILGIIAMIIGLIVNVDYPEAGKLVMVIGFFIAVGGGMKISNDNRNSK